MVYSRPSRRRVPQIQNEDGAILPIVALLIVVLLVFAAFTVDLGAAWAERRHDQSAADAAVLAAATEASTLTGVTLTDLHCLVDTPTES